MIEEKIKQRQGIGILGGFAILNSVVREILTEKGTFVQYRKRDGKETTDIFVGRMMQASRRGVYFVNFRKGKESTMAGWVEGQW